MSVVGFSAQKHDFVGMMILTHIQYTECLNEIKKIYYINNRNMYKNEIILNKENNDGLSYLLIKAYDSFINPLFLT